MEINSMDALYGYITNGYEVLVMLFFWMLSLTLWYFALYFFITLYVEKRSIRMFDNIFWSGQEMSEVYADIKKNLIDNAWISVVFISAYQMINRILVNNKNLSYQRCYEEMINRAMLVAQAKQITNSKLKLDIYCLLTVLFQVYYFSLLVILMTYSSSMFAHAYFLLIFKSLIFFTFPAILIFYYSRGEMKRVECQLQTFRIEMINIIVDQIVQRSVEPNQENQGISIDTELAGDCLH
jgi:hypothetical protein